MSNEIIEQTVKLNSNKIFDAIYVVREDGSVVKLNSKVKAKNEIVFEDKGLGRYIISYISDTNILDKEEKNDTLEKKVNYTHYIVGGIIILLVGEQLLVW